jgi:hypothetical protein
MSAKDCKCLFLKKITIIHAVLDGLSSHTSPLFLMQNSMWLKKPVPNFLNWHCVYLINVKLCMRSSVRLQKIYIVHNTRYWHINCATFLVMLTIQWVNILSLSQTHAKIFHMPEYVISLRTHIFMLIARFLLCLITWTISHSLLQANCIFTLPIVWFHSSFFYSSCVEFVYNNAGHFYKFNSTYYIFLFTVQHASIPEDGRWEVRKRTYIPTRDQPL